MNANLAQALANIKASLPKDILEAPEEDFTVCYGRPWLDSLEALSSDPRND